MEPVERRRLPLRAQTTWGLVLACALVLAFAFHNARPAAAAGQELLARIRSVRLTTALEDPAFTDGRAVYGVGVNLPGGAGKIHVRTERRYVGPLPTKEELDALLDMGAADALYPVLRDRPLQAIAARLVPLEAELATLARDLDLELDRALLAIEGTQDETVIKRSEPDAAVRIRRMVERTNRADLSRERFVNVSRQAQERWCHITKARFPRVFELQQAEQETMELRGKFLEGQVREVLLQEGVAALEPARLVNGGGR